jgi:hypothetical protein
MAGDKKLSGSWDVMVRMATGLTTVVAWLGASSDPMQGRGGSVQCGQREKKALTLLTSSGGWQLCSKAVMNINGKRCDNVTPGRRRRWWLRPARSGVRSF